VIAHLIENEARGELILVDKAKALIELERSFRSDLSSESLRSVEFAFPCFYNTINCCKLCITSFSV
jgi:hypothetical protein